MSVLGTGAADFSVEVAAKWVLSGEHAVLRGADALAFPLPEFGLRLFSQPTDSSGPGVSPTGFEQQNLALLRRAFDFLGVPEDRRVKVAIEITSDIPVGAGLGSSAALCVAIARLAIHLSGASAERLIPLATCLEDVFHGKSSGMDVSVIAIGRPILFSRTEGARAFPETGAMPRFEFEDSGLRGKTRDCIERVEEWQAAHPDRVQELDSRMREATRLAAEGLQRFQAGLMKGGSMEGDVREGEAMIQRSMNLAQGCFETWGLVTPELLAQKKEILGRGALAVKLTGAGLGGFWISLWASEGRGS
ncbi:hypothetical protein EB061_11560 [bacterium]|nr:hypothetical protein [bacterium]